MTPKDILQLESTDIRQAYLCLKRTDAGMHTNIQPTG